MALYIFNETALGLTLFEVDGFEEIEQNVKLSK
jgi:hypothetical protein